MTTPSSHAPHPTTIDVVVIEDEHLLADLLGEWVIAQPDLQLVGVYRSCAEARRELPHHRVDVMVVDLNLPDGDGLTLASEAAQGVLEGSRPRGIVILSGSNRPDLIAELPSALGSAWAYLLKGSNTTHRLRQALDAVASGLVMIDPAIHASADEAHRRFSKLTDSEQAVLALLALGLSNRAIAEEVHFSVKSVERMLTSIYSKLGIDASDDAANPRVQATLQYVSHHH
jgi:DNA-binding NarL/FixJ family response regulator